MFVEVIQALSMLPVDGASLEQVNALLLVGILPAAAL